MTGFLLCALLPLLPGAGLLRLKKNRDGITLTECYMSGLLVCFVLGAVASCMTIKLSGGFSFYCRLLAGLLLVCSLVSLFVGRGIVRDMLSRMKASCGQKKEKGRYRRRQIAEAVILLFLVAIQLTGYFLYVPDTAMDTVTETISTMMLTDSVFRYDPVTGHLLANGMYPLFKLWSLPLLYGSICGLCGMELHRFLYLAVPVWLLTVNFFVLRAWAGVLLGGQKEKRNLFLIFAGLLIVMGDGNSASYAYCLLHNGWRGSAAAAVILLMGGYILFEMLVKKEWLYGGAAILLSLGALLSAYLPLPPDIDTLSVGDKRWGMLLISVLGLYLVRERTKKRWKKQEAVLLGVCLLSGVFPGSPFPVLGIAFALTAMWSVADEWKKGVVMFAGLMIMICMTGTVLPFRADIPKWRHIPESGRVIQDKITELAETYDREVMLAAPQDVMEKARLADARILLPYGKDLWHTGCNREVRSFYPYGEEELILYEQIKVDYNQPDTVAALASGLGCDILVLRERMSDDAMRQYGWQETEKVPGYAVYLARPGSSYRK